MKFRLHHRTCQYIYLSRALEPSGITTVLYVDGTMKKSYNGRYSVRVSASGDCILRINRLQVSDGGRFTFSELDREANNQPKRIATVTVAGITFSSIWNTLQGSHCSL